MADPTAQHRPRIVPAPTAEHPWRAILRSGGRGVVITDNADARAKATFEDSEEAKAAWQYLAYGYDDRPELIDGGWTARHDGDPCRGGHPGGTYVENGVPHCPRCGRALDLRPCCCGEDGHEYLSRSFCPERVRVDQARVDRLATIDHPAASR